MTPTAEFNHQDTRSQLPGGWKWVKLGEAIVEAQHGFAIGERDPEGVIQLRMNNVTTQGQFDWSSFIRVPADSETIAAYRLQSGDVLFNNTNSTELVGKTALFEGHAEPVVFSNHFTRIRTNAEKLDSRFLAFWLHQQWQRGVFANICNRWIGQSAVQRERLLSLEIRLPSLAEQKRIARILQEQIAAVEQARRSAEAQLQAAEQLPAAHLRAVFADSEDTRWPRTRLGEVICQRQEIVHPHDKPKGRAIFVGLEHVESTTGRRVGSLDVEMSELTGRKPRFYKGDIVYGYLRPYLNKLWVAEFDGLCSVDQYVYEVNPMKADTWFIASFMRSPIYLERAPVGITPGYLPRIRTEEVASVELNLPSLADQRRIASQLSAQMASAERLRQALTDQLGTINKLPAALLRDAFSGKL
jgi:restriction endonuclease S subunit